MNGICSVLGCYFGAQFEPSDYTWTAIQVWRDGNAVVIEGGFKTEAEAEECAGQERQRQLQDNSQFGVGA